MTHREACRALEANAARFNAGRVSREAWCARVEEILRQRYPRGLGPRSVPAGVPPAPPTASRTSTAPGSRPPAAFRR